MSRTVDVKTALALVATLMFAGCASESTPLDLGGIDAESFFRTAPAPGFSALQRDVPLTRDFSASARMGPEGGELRIDEAGVVFEVPAGALREEVEITMRAIAGDAVAFEFAPHGLEFERPARILVRADGTEARHILENRKLAELRGAPLENFLGVYYEGDPGAGVEPLENIETWLVDESIAFSVWHFSGYVCASG